MSVSPSELLSISSAISRDFAPRYDNAASRANGLAAFSAQELRDISVYISRQFARDRQPAGGRLLLLSLSPGRFQLYWQMLPGAQIDAIPLHWQIVLQSTDADAETITQTLTIALHTLSGQQVIEWPDAPVAQGDYQAVLGCVDVQQHFTPLLYSNTATTSEPVSTPIQHHLLQPVLQKWLAEQPQWASSFAGFLPEIFSDSTV